MLIMMFTQMNNVLARIDRSIDLYSRVALVHHQLERDIMGACVPVEFALTQTGKPQDKKTKIPSRGP